MISWTTILPVSRDTVNRFGTRWGTANMCDMKLAAANCEAKYLRIAQSSVGPFMVLVMYYKVSVE
jgi:hypothetical protein